MQETSIAVLDTNVVLDWMVFRNPACTPFVQAIESGRLRWWATAAMRDELAHVLGRGVASDRSPDLPTLWATWDRWACTVEAPTLSGEATRIRCTDPDDQKFVDLALGHATWLISRDRAVLKLARRAARLGVQVLTPERWQPLPT
jgi:predicted nucleic acid-binding protein